MTDPTKLSDYRDVYEIKSADEITAFSQIKNEDGKWHTFVTSKMTRATEEKSSPAITPFLMFVGQAEEAMKFYESVFDDFEAVSCKKYGAGEKGKEGTVYLAEFKLAGQHVKCVDSPAVHDFTFTPSFSFFVECENEKQLDKRYKQLSEGGKVLMTINNYGFSKKFGWVSDKFGVSWQLNLK